MDPSPTRTTAGRKIWSQRCLQNVLGSRPFGPATVAVYLHTNVSTWVHGSPHLGQRSWFPPLPDPPEPDVLFPSPMLFCVDAAVSSNTHKHTPAAAGFVDTRRLAPSRRPPLRPWSAHLWSCSRRPSLKTASRVPRQGKGRHESPDDQEQRTGTWSTTNLRKRKSQKKYQFGFDIMCGGIYLI